MLIDFNKCMAFKDYNGQYDLKYINLFGIKNLEDKFKNIKVELIKNKEIRFKVYCPICGRYHFYDYDIRELVKRKMILGGCEELNIPIFYIGDSELVKNKVTKLMKINNRFKYIFFQDEIKDIY